MMSRIYYGTTEDDPDYWYMDFLVETNELETYCWIYSSLMRQITIVEHLPRNYILDKPDFFQETVQERNWG